MVVVQVPRTQCGIFPTNSFDEIIKTQSAETLIGHKCQPFECYDAYDDNGAVKLILLSENTLRLTVLLQSDIVIPTTEANTVCCLLVKFKKLEVTRSPFSEKNNCHLSNGNRK